MKVKFIQKVMNKKSNKKLVAIITSITILIGIVSATYYFEKNTKLSASAYSIDECMPKLTAAVDWRTLEFSAFLEIHFESKKNNTYLIPDAVNAFVEYKKSILKAMENYEVGTAKTTAQVAQLNACFDYAKNKILDSKKMLIKHVLNTSSTKHGQIMVEKYRNINSKLSDLNVEIGKIAGALKGFENKFPGYSQDCLTK